jgi:hypothetical protein
MRTRHLTASAAVLLVATAAFAQTPTLSNTTQAPPAPAQAPAPAAATPWFEGAFRVGGAGTDTSGNLNKAGEYLTLEDAAKVGAEFWGERNGFRFDVSAFNGGSSRDQDYRADIDIKRLVTAHVSYQKFTHRLDHDPLTYMDASSGLGGTFVAQSTDTDPGAVYSTGNGRFESRVDLRLPTVPVKLFIGHNRQTRDGSHQVMTLAHCATCHTYAFSQKVDELTRELVAGAMLQTRAVSVEYSYEKSRFSDEGSQLRLQYDNAIHPATLVDMFLNRVQYDDANGPLPFATVPGITKDAHLLKARFALPGQGTALAWYTQSSQTNDSNGLQVDTKGFTGRLHVPISTRASFRADVRRFDIDGDVTPYFVDVAEPVAPAGLTAGLTYQQAYPTFGSPDYDRESELSRTPTEFTLELGLQPVKRTFLRAGYAYEQIERRHFDVEKTKTNTLYLTGNSRFGKRASLRFRFQHDAVTDPFAYEHAAIPEVIQPYASPGNSPLTGMQYFTMYRSRQAALSGLPTSATRFDGTFSITPADRLSMTFHYNFRTAENDDLNFSEWGRTAHAPGVDLYFSPGDRVTLSAGYVHQKEQLETLFSTLAFGG